MRKLMASLVGLTLCLTTATASSARVSLDLREQKAAVPSAPRKLMKVAAAPKSDVLRQGRLAAGATKVAPLNVGDTLGLQLFEGAEIELTLKELTDGSMGGRSFLAEANGYAGVKNAVVVETADGLQMDIQDYKTGKVYTVYSGADGVVVKELAPVRGRTVPTAETPPPEMLLSADEVEAMGLSASDAPGDTRLDILVAFDANARSYAEHQGGGMTNFAQVAVQKMNAALANTGLSELFRFRLVGVTTVDASETDVHEALYAVSAGTGAWAAIAKKREEVGADLVTTLIDTGSAVGTVGVGWSLSGGMDPATFSESAYNVCAIQSVAQDHTMAHECGHNLGAGHSERQMTEPGPQLYDYSAGYYFTVDGTFYHTIMAYDDDGVGNSYTPVPYFSSPDYTYLGVPVGDAMHDNTRTLRNTFAAAAAWRERVVPMTYDVTFSPAAGATFDGTLAVTLTAEKPDAVIRYTTDGSAPTVDSPVYTGPIILTETTTIRAIAVEDGVGGVPFEAKYWTIPSLGAALGAPELEWSTSPGNPWQVQTDRTYDGIAVSGTGESWLATTVRGPISMSFKYFLDERMSILIDGIVVDTRTFYSRDWSVGVYDFDEGEHEIRVVCNSGSLAIDDIEFLGSRRPLVDFKKGALGNDSIVSLTHKNPSAKIFFTLDGTQPTMETGIEYDGNGPFFVSKDTMVRAIACEPGQGVSAERSMPVRITHNGQHKQDIRPGEWGPDFVCSSAAAKRDGRLIVIYNGNRETCAYSREFEKYAEDRRFLDWAAVNGVYLVSVDASRYPDGSYFDAWIEFCRLTEIAGMSSSTTPSLVFVAPNNKNKVLAGHVGSTFKSVDELVRYFSSILGGVPLQSPVASVTNPDVEEYPFEVNLTNPNGSGQIFYTVDGSEPNLENGIPYGQPIRIEKSRTTLKAAIWSDDEKVASVPISITYASCDDPAEEPERPPFTAPQDVQALFYSPYGPLVRWEDVDEATSYRVYGGDSDDFQSAVLLGESKLPRYWDVNASSHGPRHYWVSSVREGHESGLSRRVTIEDIPFRVEFDLGEKGVYIGGSLRQWLSAGKKARAPRVKGCEGWRFAGWDGELGNVREDRIIKARYVACATVRLDLGEHGVWDDLTVGAKECLVDLGQSCRPMAFHPDPGYRFVGWSKDVTCVTSGMFAEALYEPIAIEPISVEVVADWYVDQAHGDDGNSGKSVESPFATLQRAVESVRPGETIAVNDGIYQPFSLLPSKPRVTIFSVNGKHRAIIDGGRSQRCAWLNTGVSEKSTLQGFTLRNGYSADDGGGSYDGRLIDCLLYGNVSSYGGGACRGELRDCFLRGNSATRGGGAAAADLDHCIVDSNSADEGGGSAFCNSVACQYRGNVSKVRAGGGIYGGSAESCVFVANVSANEGGAGCSADFYGCTLFRNTAVAATACQGGSLSNCIVWNDDGRLGQSSVLDCQCNYVCIDDKSVSGIAVFYDDPCFVAEEDEDFRLSDDSPCRDAGFDYLGAFSSRDYHGNPRVMGRRVDLGACETVDIEKQQEIRSAARLYVSASTGDEANTGLDPDHPKRSLQGAIEAAVNGDRIVVDDGVYGAIATFDLKLIVESVNGPLAAVIDAGGGGRCVTCGSQNDTDVSVRGFTIRNGNMEHGYGGGALYGRYSQCIFTQNTAGSGGGAASAYLTDCLFFGNYAQNGGGTIGGEMCNCTVADNYAGSGGGAYGGTCRNCIVWGNYSGDHLDALSSTCSYTCAGNHTGGERNVTADPLFADVERGDFRLREGSPCVNAGDNGAVVGMFDLPNYPRISGGSVDMGAFERQVAGIRFDANGGTGVMADIPNTGSTPVVLPFCAFTRMGHSFAGWATSPAGEVVYADGATVHGLPTDICLYAQWVKDQNVCIHGDYVYFVSDDRMTLHAGPNKAAIVPGPVGHLDIPAELDGHPIVAIGDDAFAYCNQMTSVMIPNSVTNLGSDVFFGCHNLCAVEVADDNLAFASVDGVLYDKQKRKLIYCPPGKTSVRIPPTVTELGDSSFYECQKIVTIDLPQGLKKIGKSAFAWCVGLKSIRIPEGVEVIGDMPFQMCYFTSIVLPRSVEYVERPFYGCKYLKSVYFKGNAPSYPDRLGPFLNASEDLVVYVRHGSWGWSDPDSDALPDVWPPNSKDSRPIAYWEGEPALEQYHLRYEQVGGGGAAPNPSSYTPGDLPIVLTPPTRDGYRFLGWTLNGEPVTEIAAGTTGDLTLTATWDADYGCTYSLANGEVTLYKGWGKAAVSPLPIGDFVVPSELGGCPVTSIGDTAFDGCDQMTSVTIPASVMKLGSAVFRGCSKLTSVYFMGNAPQCDDWNTLSGTPENLTIYVRHGSWGWRDPQTDALPDAWPQNSMNSRQIAYWEDEPPILHFRISYELDGGENEAENPSSYMPEELPIALASPTRDGYRFLGWTLNGEQVTQIAAGTTGDLTLTATWEADYHYSYSISNGKATLYKGGLFGEAAVSPLPVGEFVVPSELGGCPVTSIGDFAFAQCEKMTSVTIPASVTSIGEYVFVNCWSLTAIEVADDNPAFSSEDGVLYDKQKRTLICCPPGKTSVRIASSVVEIGYEAFSQCEQIEEIELPSGLKKIGDRAFSYCYALTGLTLPDGLEEIGSEAFHSCRFASIILPEGVRLYTSPFANSEVTSVYFRGNAPKTDDLGWLFDWTSEDLTVYVRHGSRGWIDPRTDELPELWPMNSSNSRRIAYWESEPPMELFRVAYELGGGVNAPGNPTTFAADDLPIVLAEPTRKGYRFLGWTPNGGVIPVGTAANVTFMALWEKIVEPPPVKPPEEPQSDEPMVVCAVKAEYRTKADVGVVPVKVVNVKEAVKIAVKGLPSGVKFTAKDIADRKSKKVTVPANSIYGTPTKSGVYAATVTVTPTNKKSKMTTLVKTLTFVVRNAGEHIVRADYDVAQGAVKGMGVYAKGKKVTLKATAAKGWVFAGWRSVGESADSTDLASWSFTMPNKDVKVSARFVTVAADKKSIGLKVDGTALSGGSGQETASPLKIVVKQGMYVEWPVAASALSATTVKVSGLPSGLKFTAKDVKATKTSAAVPANTIYGTPKTASKVDKNGKSTPSKVKITVTTAGKQKQEYVLNVTVRGIPAEGTFNGGMVGSGASLTSGRETASPLGGLVTLTVAKTGKISGKYLADGKTWTLSAAGFDTWDDHDCLTATLTAKSGKEVKTVKLTYEDGYVCASLTSGQETPRIAPPSELASLGGYASPLFEAWRNEWKTAPQMSLAKTLKGKKVQVGEVLLTVGSNGAVTAKGTFGSYSASCSTVLIPVGSKGTYVVYLYFPPKAGKFAGWTGIAELVWDGYFLQIR